MHIFGGEMKEGRTIKNFPCQATGAEILRVACILLVENNIKIIAPIHDAILIECDEEETYEIIFIASFYPVLLSTISGVSKVDPMYLKVAQNFGIKQPYLLSKIIFPAAFPLITNGLHMALGSAWVFLVAGEMVGA